MRFNSEAERMEHPQARLIPLSVWERDDLFNQELSDYELTLMKTAPSDLDDDLASFTREKKYTAWLALAYAHPDMDDALLLRFADRLGLSNDDCFKLTVIVGKLSLLHKMIETNGRQIQSMIAAGRYGVFLDAVKHGHLDVVNCLIDKLTELAPDEVQAMISIHGDRGFISAMSRGFLPIMERLLELEPAIMDRVTYEWIQKAVINGHLPVIERVFFIFSRQSVPSPKAMIQAENYQLCHDAAFMGHLPLLKYLMGYEQHHAQDMLRTHGVSILRAAFRGEEQSRRKNINHAYACRDAHLIAIANESNSLTHTHVIHHLLSFPQIFAYAELREKEHWAPYIPPVIDAKLRILQERRAAFEANNPQAVFEITDPEEAKLCFYILGNLIRRNDPALLDDIRFLVDTLVAKTTRQELDLSDINLGPEGASRVAEALKYNYSLLTLDGVINEEITRYLERNNAIYRCLSPLFAFSAQDELDFDELEACIDQFIILAPELMSGEHSLPDTHCLAECDRLLMALSHLIHLNPDEAIQHLVVAFENKQLHMLADKALTDALQSTVALDDAGPDIRKARNQWFAYQYRNQPENPFYKLAMYELKHPEEKVTLDKLYLESQVIDNPFFFRDATEQDLEEKIKIIKTIIAGYFHSPDETTLDSTAVMTGGLFFFHRPVTPLNAQEKVSSELENITDKDAGPEI
ncbi:MAG: hypothetical protein P1U39_05830 [Legionellaceae bacterium]|nr:hypothetical protein [Legionellaceae bacterium]